MKIRREQLNRLRAAKLETLRRDRFIDLRNHGFHVAEGPEPGTFLVEDRAGGTAQVVSKGPSVSLTTAERRTFQTEQYDYGRIKYVTDPLGNRASFERDEHGLLTALDCGNGRRHRFSHELPARLLGIQYPDGTETRSHYDALGRLVAVTDRNGNVTRYAYGPDGLLERMTDPKSSETRLVYDGWDLPSAIHYPNGNSQAFRYDEHGRIAQLLVNNKLHAQFSLAETPDRHEIKYTDGTWARYQTADGHLAEATNAALSVRFEYDERGRLVAEHTADHTIRYERNATGALTGIVTPPGEKVLFARDADQRLIGLTDWTGGRYVIENDKAGPPVRITFPNKLVASRTFTTTGVISSMTLAMPGISEHSLESCRWEYDLCDRAVQMDRAGHRRRYRYDKAGRLVGVDSDNNAVQESFTLDPKGNQIRAASGATVYDGADQLTRRGDEIFTHDEIGNMTSGVCPRGHAEYTYNGGGQLIAVSTPAGIARYAYDAVGRRIRKECGTQITDFVWAGPRLLSETLTVGSVVTRRDYLWDPERPIPYAMRENGKVYNLHVGARCEVFCMTDAAGSVVWRADYKAFGSPQVNVNLVAQPWRLAGQYFDEETGLHYNVARYYDPELGRFLTVDPVVDGGPSRNPYLYGDGDPINRVDSTGTIGAFLTGVLIGAAVGAVIGAAIGVGIEMYREREQEHFDVWKITKAGLIGGAIGLIGGAVGAAVEGAALVAMGVGAAVEAGAVGATTAMAAGALAGEVSAAVEYCAEVAFTDTKFDRSELGKAIVIGGTVGAVTAGVGGLFAARAARKVEREAAKELARAEQEAARKLPAATEAAERAAREAEQAARELKEAQEKVARAAKAKRGEDLKAERSARARNQKLQDGIKEAEARGKAKKLSPDDQKWLEESPRNKELAYDPDTKSFKPKEAKAGLQAEKEGTLDPPVTRSIDESGNSGGGDLVDGKGKAWDVKDASGGKDPIVDAAKPKGGKPGEDVLVDCSDMTPKQQATLEQDVARDLPKGSGEVRFTPKRNP
jgi:RHS repeat-associated protein